MSANKPKVDVKPTAVSPKVSPKIGSSPLKPSTPTGSPTSKSQSIVSSLAKAMNGLAVSSSGQRRLSTSNSTGIAISPSSSSPVNLSPTKDPAKITQTRRRLSIMGGNLDPKFSLAALDGATLEESKEIRDVNRVSRGGEGLMSPRYQEMTNNKKQRIFHSYSSLSRVGFVPFNPNKVNQDRAAEIVNFGNQDEKAFFAVFDGHGALGHEVSQFCTVNMPQTFLKQADLDTNPSEAIVRAFVECTNKLSKSGIDASFSGTTAIVVYLNGDKIYSCNAGDSRAVLGRVAASANGTSSSTSANKYEAIALSSDQKPERADERERIIASKGRVEACHGARGEDIGPLRVWLRDQDVPGLAMTRSIGDFVAASVGVSCVPEVWTRTVHDDDRFIIIASDGVWEFISSQEAVNMVSKASTPEEACKLLTEEATKRWHREEEVVDDITAVVIFF